VPLAALVDVKRVARSVGTDADGALVAALQVAEELVIQYLRWNPAATTPTTRKYFNVREDETIPHPGGTVTAVRLYTSADGTARVATNLADYEVQDGQIQLRTSDVITPFEGAEGRRMLGSWARVEVDYTPAVVIPAAIRDATALTAASIYETSPGAISGVVSESMGGYSYSRAPTKDNRDVTIPTLAKGMLRPHRRRRSLVP
jgi:hypothetical protein